MAERVLPVDLDQLSIEAEATLDKVLELLRRRNLKGSDALRAKRLGDLGERAAERRCVVERVSHPEDQFSAARAGFDPQV
jgi:hypothetical protein